MKRAPFFALSGSLINSSSEVAWGWDFYGIRALLPRNSALDQKFPRKILRENLRKIPKPWDEDREFLIRKKFRTFCNFYIQTWMIDSCRIMAFSLALLFLLANLAF